MLRTLPRETRLISRLAQLLAVTAVTLAPAATAVSALPARAHQTGQARMPVDVVVERVSPATLRPNSTLKVSGQIYNRGGEAPSSVWIRLRYSTQPFWGRTQLDQYANGGPPLDQPVLSSQIKIADRLAVDMTAPWQLELKAKALGLRAFGVYPLAVEVVDAAGQRLGLTRTFLPFVPDRARPKPINVAWIWPVVDRPHRADDATFVDADLDQALSPAGRLGALVQAGAARKIPLTWVVDPALLGDAHAMAEPHRLAVGDRVIQRPASKDARTWMARMQGATQNANVIALPYADVDVAALTHVGRDRDLDLAVRNAPRLTRLHLPQAAVQSVAWPTDGLVDQDTLDGLAVAGLRTAVLADTVFPPVRRANYTPDAVVEAHSVNGSVKVLLADSALSTVLGNPRPQPAALARQRFLAETALIAAERPNEPRSVVIAPPRRWNPDPALAAALLGDTARAPWLRPVRLDTLRRGPIATERAGPVYPPQAQARELHRRYLSTVKAIQRDADRLASVIATGHHPFELALLRTESTAWRDDQLARDRLRDAVARTVGQRLARVRIINHRPPTLTGTEGTVPVTIANDLGQEVAVQLKVASVNPTRLRIGSYPQSIRIPGQQKFTVRVPMTALANGTTDVKLQLRTPQNSRFGSPVVLKVRATGYGGTALLIIGIALAVLLLGVAGRVAQARRRNGPPPTGEAPDVAPAESVPTVGGDGPTPTPVTPVGSSASGRTVRDHADQ